MNERRRHRTKINRQVASGRKHLEHVSIKAAQNEFVFSQRKVDEPSPEQLQQDITIAVLTARLDREPTAFEISRHVETVTAEVRTEQERWDSHIATMMWASEGKPADSPDPVNPNSWSYIMATDKALQDASFLTGKYITDVRQIGEELVVSYATNPLVMADRLRTYQERNGTQDYTEKIDELEKEAEDKAFHPYGYTEKFKNRNRQQYRLAETMASEYLVRYGNPNPTFTEKDRYRLIFESYLKGIQRQLETEIAKLNGEMIEAYNNPTKLQREAVLRVAEQEVFGTIGMIVDKEDLTREELASSVLRAIVQDPDEVAERIKQVSELVPELDLKQVQEVLELTKDGPGSEKSAAVIADSGVDVKNEKTPDASHDAVPLTDGEVTIWEGIKNTLGPRDEMNKSIKTPFPGEEPEVGGSSQGSIAEQEDGPDTDFGQGNNKGKSK